MVLQYKSQKLIDFFMNENNGFPINSKNNTGYFTVHKNGKQSHLIVSGIIIKQLMYAKKDTFVYWC